MNYTMGIDISKYQGYINNIESKLNFKEIEQIHPDIKFCFAKSTEGINYIDPHFYANAKNLESSTIFSGSYHFFQPNNPIPQAEFYYQKTFDYTQLPPVIDIEKANPNSSHWDLAKTFIEKTEELWNQECIIYSYAYFIKDIPKKLQDFFTKRKLWIAIYNCIDQPGINPNDTINNIKPWKNWTMHQKSGDNAFKLFNKIPTDLNTFNGDLKSFIDTFNLKDKLNKTKDWYNP